MEGGVLSYDVFDSLEVRGDCGVFEPVAEDGQQ